MARIGSSSGDIFLCPLSVESKLVAQRVNPPFPVLTFELGDTRVSFCKTNAPWDAGFIKYKAEGVPDEDGVTLSIFTENPLRASDVAAQAYGRPLSGNELRLDVAITYPATRGHAAHTDRIGSTIVDLTDAFVSPTALLRTLSARPLTFVAPLYAPQTVAATSLDAVVDKWGAPTESGSSQNPPAAMVVGSVAFAAFPRGMASTPEYLRALVGYGMSLADPHAQSPLHDAVRLAIPDAVIDAPPPRPVVGQVRPVVLRLGRAVAPAGRANYNRPAASDGAAAVDDDADAPPPPPRGALALAFATGAAFVPMVVTDTTVPVSAALSTHADGSAARTGAFAFTDDVATLAGLGPSSAQHGTPPRAPALVPLGDIVLSAEEVAAYRRAAAAKKKPAIAPPALDADADALREYTDAAVLRLSRRDLVAAVAVAAANNRALAARVGAVLPPILASAPRGMAPPPPTATVAALALPSSRATTTTTTTGHHHRGRGPPHVPSPPAAPMLLGPIDSPPAATPGRIHSAPAHLAIAAVTAPPSPAAAAAAVDRSALSTAPPVPSSTVWPLAPRSPAAPPTPASIHAAYTPAAAAAAWGAFGRAPTPVPATPAAAVPPTPAPHAAGAPTAWGATAARAGAPRSAMSRLGTPPIPPLWPYGVPLGVHGHPPDGAPTDGTVPSPAPHPITHPRSLAMLTAGGDGARLATPRAPALIGANGPPLGYPYAPADTHGTPTPPARSTLLPTPVPRVTSFGALSTYSAATGGAPQGAPAHGAGGEGQVAGRGPGGGAGASGGSGTRDEVAGHSRRHAGDDTRSRVPLPVAN